MRSVMWKRIVLLLAMAFLTPLATQAARTKIIMRAFVDLNGDGRRDAVAIRMISGRFYKADDPADESCPSCACGAPKYSGKFRIEVNVVGRKPVSQDLNELMGGYEELEFWAEPWQVTYDDYNHDGRIDFNIGQFGNCGGWVYRLFTVARSGRVSRLKVKDGNPDSEIFADDDNNSTRVIRSTPKGFYTRGYYNAADPVGFYTSYYTWNVKKRSFIFVKDVYDLIQKKVSPTVPHWAQAN